MMKYEMVSAGMYAWHKKVMVLSEHLLVGASGTKKDSES